MFIARSRGGSTQARRLLSGRDNLGQAEVENLGLTAIRDEYVCRLDVAVDDALSVGSVEPVGSLDGNIQKAFDL